MDSSRKARNVEIVESAIAMRNAMNADKKEFDKFLEFYSNEDEGEKEARQVAEGVQRVSRLFGGS
jgi:hypothetical protein